MAENCIEACLDSLENGLEKNSRIDLEIKHHFMKFETIAMQAISLLFSDCRSSEWPYKLLERICRHCLRIVHRWRAKNKLINERNHIGRVPMSFNSSALLFTLTILVKGNWHRLSLWIYSIPFSFSKRF